MFLEMLKKHFAFGIDYRYDPGCDFLPKYTQIQLQIILFLLF
jgi:hypothetical protein